MKILGAIIALKCFIRVIIMGKLYYKVIVIKTSLY